VPIGKDRRTLQFMRLVRGCRCVQIASRQYEALVVRNPDRVVTLRDGAVVSWLTTAARANCDGASLRCVDFLSLAADKGRPTCER
jgi:hypothetical protein